MEFIIALVVAAVAGWFLFFRYKETVVPEKLVTATPTEEAPYKVEAPVAAPVAPLGDTTSGGGPEIDLSPAPVVVAEVAPAKKPRKPRAPKVEAKPVKVKAPAKAPAKIKAAPKKAVTTKAPVAKKPRAKKV